MFILVQGRICVDLINPNRINDYFLSVFEKTYNCYNKISFYNSNKYKANIGFSFTMVDPDTVRKHVYSINSNAAGNDNLTLFMIKLCLSVILNHLTHIINCCMEHGYFPKCWKESIVCPVPKVRNSSDVSELRPISLFFLKYLRMLFTRRLLIILGVTVCFLFISRDSELVTAQHLPY